MEAWMSTLMKAATAVKKQKGEDFVINTVSGCWDGGVVFETSYFTYIKWYPDGTITERGKDEWRTK